MKSILLFQKPLWIIDPIILYQQKKKKNRFWEIHPSTRALPEI